MTCGAVSRVQEEGRGQQGTSGCSWQAWRGGPHVPGFTGKRQEEEEAGSRSQPSVQAAPPWNPSPPESSQCLSAGAGGVIAWLPAAFLQREMA